MSLQITGQIAYINHPVQNNNYTSQTIIVLVEPGQYQTYVELSFGGNNLNIVQTLQPGGTYTFHLNLRGSKNMMASNKIPGAQVAFNSLQVWKADPVQGAGLPQTSHVTAPSPYQQAPQPQYQQPQYQQPAPQPGYAPPQQQGGFVGQPAGPSNPPAQGTPFGAPPAQGNNFGGGAPNPEPAQGTGFGNPPANTNPFGAPQP